MNGSSLSVSSVSLLIYLYLFMKNGIHLVSAKNAKNKIEASILRRKHSWLEVVGGHILVGLLWLYWLSSYYGCDSTLSHEQWLPRVGRCRLVQLNSQREINSFYGHFQSGPQNCLHLSTTLKDWFLLGKFTGSLPAPQIQTLLHSIPGLQVQDLHLQFYARPVSVWKLQFTNNSADKFLPRDEIMSKPFQMVG